MPTKKQEKYFRELSEMLDEDLDKMTRENQFAFYGYLYAFTEMGLVTSGQYKELLDRLDLTTEETDDLLL